MGMVTVLIDVLVRTIGRSDRRPLACLDRRSDSDERLAACGIEIVRFDARRRSEPRFGHGRDDGADSRKVGEGCDIPTLNGRAVECEFGPDREFDHRRACCEPDDDQPEMPRRWHPLEAGDEVGAMGP
jgi:hypothetical protein